MLGAIVAGTASYYVIERPARSYLNRTWGQRSGGISLTRPST